MDQKQLSFVFYRKFKIFFFCLVFCFFTCEWKINQLKADEGSLIPEVVVGDDLDEQGEEDDGAVFLSENEEEKEKNNQEESSFQITNDIIDSDIFDKKEERLEQEEKINDDTKVEVVPLGDNLFEKENLSEKTFKEDVLMKSDFERYFSEEKKTGIIKINEVAWMGSKQSSYDEWIELYNSNDFSIDLSGWTINFWKPLKNSQGEIVAFDENVYNKPYFSISLGNDLEIFAGDFFLLGREKYNQGISDLIDISYKGTLVNEGGYLQLKNSQGEIVDYLDALSGWPGGDNDQKLTLEKNKDDSDWHTSLVEGGTPRKENSLLKEELEDSQEGGTFSNENQSFVCKEYLAGKWLNEILPNPDGIDLGQEWVELKNENIFTVDLIGWKLVNSSGKTFSFGEIVLEAGESKKIDLPKSFVVKNQQEKIQLFSCKNVLKDELSFSESAPSGRSYNRDENNNWRWSPHLTPGEENIFNSLPWIKVQRIRESYLNLPILFDASESFDSDGNALKFIWDFGDGKKSYLGKVSHIFTSIGKKEIKLKVSDGSETVEKIIDLEIKKYPQRKISFVKILPNPQGVDLGKELIWLKNYNSKRVNLKGWKILSGSSKETAIVHPINQDFFLKRGEEKVLSRKECLFSLNNKAGYLALIYPDGEKANEIEYAFEKEIPEGGEYFLNTSGQWQWNFSEDFSKDNKKIEINDSIITNEEEKEDPMVLGDQKDNFWENLFADLGREKTLSWKEMDFLGWQKKNKLWLDFLFRMR